LIFHQPLAWPEAYRRLACSLISSLLTVNLETASGWSFGWRGGDARAGFTPACDRLTRSSNRHWSSGGLWCSVRRPQFSLRCWSISSWTQLARVLLPYVGDGARPSAITTSAPSSHDIAPHRGPLKPTRLEYNQIHRGLQMVPKAAWTCSAFRGDDQWLSASYRQFSPPSTPLRSGRDTFHTVQPGPQRSREAPCIRLRQRTIWWRQWRRSLCILGTAPASVCIHSGCFYQDLQKGPQTEVACHEKEKTSPDLSARISYLMIGHPAEVCLTSAWQVCNFVTFNQRLISVLCGSWRAPVSACASWVTGRRAGATASAKVFITSPEKSNNCFRIFVDIETVKIGKKGRSDSWLSGPSSVNSFSMSIFVAGSLAAVLSVRHPSALFRATAPHHPQRTGCRRGGHLIGENVSVTHDHSTRLPWLWLLGGGPEPCRRAPHQHPTRPRADS